MRTPMVVDNFAGGGGASLGIEQAIGRPVDVAINHDRLAIAMHEANHPDTRHYHDDIWSVDPREVARGREIALAWFSPDCTHFSKAAGRRPRDKGIRGLAWVVIEWAARVRPNVIMLENVEEFRTWGPLDDEGYPIPDRAGETFGEWLQALRGLGYEVEWRELRAHEYGAPTIRKRLFIIARCDGEPIVWPERTHDGDAMPYRTAAECIDWSIPCPSIFERRRPLAENTMRRIANGVRRYVLEAREPFIVRTGHYSNITGEGATFRGQSTAQPLSTVTSVNDYGLVVPHVASLTHRGGDRVESLEEPFRTITAAHRGEKALIAPAIVRMNHADQAKPSDSVEEPLRTITSQHNKHQLVEAFLARHFGGMTGRDLRDPLPTTLGKGAQNQLVAAHIVKHFGGQVGQSAERPLPTITTRNVTTQVVASHLVKLYGTAQDGAPLTEPMPTVTATGQHVGEVRAFLLKYYGNDRNGQGLADPMHTVTSRDRLGLVTVEGEDYQIIDIGMRMLTPRELFRAQGFPEGYVIDPIVDGKRLTKTAQVRMCGNSVSPPVARALVAANVGRLETQGRWNGYELAEVAS